MLFNLPFLCRRIGTTCRACPICWAITSPAALCRVLHALPANVYVQDRPRFAVFCCRVPGIAESSCQFRVELCRVLPELRCQRASLLLPSFSLPRMSLPGREVEITIKPAWNGEDARASAATDRAASLFAAQDNPRNTDPAERLCREELYDCKILR